jgi:hypothetical protein
MDHDTVFMKTEIELLGQSADSKPLPIAVDAYRVVGPTWSGRLLVAKGECANLAVNLTDSPSFFQPVMPAMAASHDEWFRGVRCQRLPPSHLLLNVKGSPAVDCAVCVWSSNLRDAGPVLMQFVLLEAVSNAVVFPEKDEYAPFFDEIQKDLGAVAEAKVVFPWNRPDTLVGSWGGVTITLSAKK